jgi:hypothetical protein
MSRKPTLAAAFKGRWRIKMDMIGGDDLDLDGTAHIISRRPSGGMTFGDPERHATTATIRTVEAGLLLQS